MAALRILVHEHRCCSVFQHLGSCLLAGIGQSLFSIVDNQFLAKGVDEVLGSTRDDELIGIGGGKLDGIADFISPESARGRDHHRVVLACLHSPERYRFVLLFSFLLPRIQRNELVEYAVVEHQQHGLVCGIILNTEEPFTGIVGFHIVHVGRRDEALVLLAIRREGHTSVEEDLDIRPHLLEVRLTCDFHHAGEHREHPRGYARDVGHVLIHRLSGNALALDLEVRDEGRLFLRYPHEVHQRIDVLDEDGTEVAHQ